MKNLGQTNLHKSKYQLSDTLLHRFCRFIMLCYLFASHNLKIMYTILSLKVRKQKVAHFCLQAEYSKHRALPEILLVIQAAFKQQRYLNVKE